MLLIRACLGCFHVQYWFEGAFMYSMGLRFLFKSRAQQFYPESNHADGYRVILDPFMHDIITHSCVNPNMLLVANFADKK